MVEDISTTKKGITSSEEAVLLSRFFEAGFALFCIFSSGGKFIRANKAWEDMLGYEPEELVGKNIADFIYRKDLEATRKAISEVFAGKQALDLVNRFRSKDGGYRCLEWQAVPFGDLIYACAQDVTPFASKEMSEMQATVDRYLNMFNSSPAMMVISSAVTGRITEVNHAFIQKFGFSKDEILGNKIADLNIYKQIPGHIENPVFFEQESFQNMAVTLKSKQGDIVECLCFGARLETRNEEVIFTVMADVTGLVESERTTRERAGRFESILDAVPEALFYKAPDGVYFGCNSLCAEILKIEKDEIIGKTDFDLFDPETAQNFREVDRKVYTSRQTIRCEEWCDFGDGEKKLQETVKAPFEDARGNVLGIVGITRDITKNKLWEKEIQYLSFHDQMTGLYNRRFYEEELKRIDVERNLPITIIMADVDSLKFVNDAFGHEEGDGLIKHTAQAIKSSCRSEDIIARVGGDEFAMVLPHTDSVTSEKVLERIDSLISKEKVGMINISVSFGSVTKTHKDQDINEIIRQAEKKMYRNKLARRSETKVNAINDIISTLFEKCQREMVHSKRVGAISSAIAKHMGMNREEVNKVRLAGIMHDIGKIDIDDNILNKKDKLSEYEREAINNHPELGYRILSASKEFSDIAMYVGQHHENWDGSGYPKGLSGEEILLPARIVAVAGAYDSMAHPFYKSPMSRENIVEELKRCSGKEFDPAVVSVFIEKVLTDPNLDL